MSLTLSTIMIDYKAVETWSHYNNYFKWLKNQLQKIFKN